MSIEISMDLFETDKKSLLDFISGDTNQTNLILYDFATDLIYSDLIQSDLLEVLLPSYLYNIRQAQLSEDRDAFEIEAKFNTAIFLNKNSIRTAIGDSLFQHLMSSYLNVLIELVDLERSKLNNWIPFFNTVIAFNEINFSDILKEIFNATTQGKLSFFLYLSSILIPRKDNLFSLVNSELYETPLLWEYIADSEDRMYWAIESLNNFNMEVNFSLIKTLFFKVKSELERTVGIEEVYLFQSELEENRIGLTDTLETRKKEYLERISKAISKAYWDDAF